MKIEKQSGSKCRMGFVKINVCVSADRFRPVDLFSAGTIWYMKCFSRRREVSQSRGLVSGV